MPGGPGSATLGGSLAVPPEEVLEREERAAGGEMDGWHRPRAPPFSLPPITASLAAPVCSGELWSGNSSLEERSEGPSNEVISRRGS